MTIKILHVAPLPPPPGGMASYIQGLLHSGLAESVDMRVVRLDYLNKERFSGFVREIVNFLNAFILTLNFLLQTILWRPNIVHIQANSGFGFFEKCWIAALAKLLGRKTLMHVHGGNFREWHARAARSVQWLIRFGARLNDRLLAASPQMVETWRMIGLPESKLVRIGNAVELPELHGRTESRGKIVILFLTRIVFAKGIIELIEAVSALHAKLDALELRIVGAQELETARVKQYLGERNASDFIQFIGPVSETQKEDEYRRADIFAFPTHVEDQSYAVMEAMSYGLAVVASDVGGVPSLIQHEANGLLVPPKNADALAGALEKLARSPALRAQLGASARKTIEDNFSWKTRAREMEKLYEAVLRR